VEATDSVLTQLRQAGHAAAARIGQLIEGPPSIIVA
jgi:hypothetical protein